MPTFEAQNLRYPGARYDPSISSPDSCLGFSYGHQMARAKEIIECFRIWEKQSARVKVERYAVSHEGRELVRVIISAPKHLEQLDTLRANIAKLADPRKLSAQEAEKIIEQTPAIGWFGYSIHGDETSGADASLAFGYYLASGVDSRLKEILEKTVVVIDPVMNPDGRHRIINQVEQATGVTPNLNYRGYHRGYWPWGRGNHYLFDMNRDWIIGTQPETRGRWQGLLRYRPQILVDAHEMGSNDTYLFYPRAKPINKNFGPAHHMWSQVFAKDQAGAFDQYGWPYYTREWADGWYPGYTDAWGSLLGAIGILYEQARVLGKPLKQKSGAILTHKDAVYHHAVSSFANLRTLSRNREALLRNFWQFHRRAVDGPKQSFVLRAGHVPDREHALVELLLRQGIEVWRADRPFGGRGMTPLDARQRQLRFKKGDFLIDTAQPRGALVQALLDFDPRFSDEFLRTERQELEQENKSGLYDITAWNLFMSFALDGAQIDTPKVARSRLSSVPRSPSGRVGEEATAWVVSGAYDHSLRFAVGVMEERWVVRVADKKFTASGDMYPAGSLLLRSIENPQLNSDNLGAIAHKVGVEVRAVRTSLSTGPGPDLGGQHFRLLHRPRIAVLANVSGRPSDFGHVWYHIDQNLQAPATLIEGYRLSQIDLRKYNVLVVPPASNLEPLFDHIDAVKAWVQSGGTLVAMGSSAAALTHAKLGLSKVRRRRDVLEDIPSYQSTMKRWFEARAIDVDPQNVWEARDRAQSKTVVSKPPSGLKTPRARADFDAWMRRFSPQGAFVRGYVDTTHWLNFGSFAEQQPLLVRGSHVLMAPETVSVPLRLGRASRLRLSGLLWPEARARLEGTAWSTVEQIGNGQLILFSMSPVFRAHQRGAARFFSNAIVLGPSLGAHQPSEW